MAANRRIVLIGYFLYKDGIRVNGDGPQLEPIGKLSLNEVFADHDPGRKGKILQPVKQAHDP